MDDPHTITVPGVFSVSQVREGDKVTIVGIMERVPNPHRHWWQFWKPRTVATKKLQQFTVIGRR